MFGGKQILYNYRFLLPVLFWTKNKLSYGSVYGPTVVELLLE